LKKKLLADSHLLNLNGHTPWNKGKKLSKEHKRRISVKAKQRVLSLEHRNKISKSLKKGIREGVIVPWHKAKTGVYSKETKRRMSESRKRYLKSLRNN
jgi:hypothetical protein